MTYSLILHSIVGVTLGWNLVPLWKDRQDRPLNLIIQLVGILAFCFMP